MDSAPGASLAAAAGATDSVKRLELLSFARLRAARFDESTVHGCVVAGIRGSHV